MFNMSFYVRNYAIYYIGLENVILLMSTCTYWLNMAYFGPKCLSTKLKVVHLSIFSSY